MPFELMNAPATFESMVTELFGDMDSFHVYIADVVVRRETLDEHLQNATAVWKRIRDTKLRLKLEKGSIRMSKVEVLGHIGSFDGMTQTLQSFQNCLCAHITNQKRAELVLDVLLFL